MANQKLLETSHAQAFYMTLYVSSLASFPAGH